MYQTEGGRMTARWMLGKAQTGNCNCTELLRKSMTRTGLQFEKLLALTKMQGINRWLAVTVRGGLLQGDRMDKGLTAALWKACCGYAGPSPAWLTSKHSVPNYRLVRNKLCKLSVNPTFTKLTVSCTLPTQVSLSTSRSLSESPNKHLNRLWLLC